MLDKLAGATQDFFRVIRPDRLAGGKGETQLSLHSTGAPGFADAEAVDTPGPQMRDHLRWRYHHAVDIQQRVNALAGEPVIQPHGVGAGWKRLGEGEF